MSGDHHGLHLYSGIVYGCRAAFTGPHSSSHPVCSSDLGRPDPWRMGLVPVVVPVSQVLLKG